MFNATFPHGLPQLNTFVCTKLLESCLEQEDSREYAYVCWCLHLFSTVVSAQLYLCQHNNNSPCLLSIIVSVQVYLSMLV